MRNHQQQCKTILPRSIPTFTKDHNLKHTKQKSPTKHANTSRQTIERDSNKTN